jgi:hypothetical protein
MRFPSVDPLGELSGGVDLGGVEDGEGGDEEHPGGEEARARQAYWSNRIDQTSRRSRGSIEAR